MARRRYKVVTRKRCRETKQEDVASTYERKLLGDVIRRCYKEALQGGVTIRRNKEKVHRDVTKRRYKETLHDVTRGASRTRGRVTCRRTSRAGTAASALCAYARYRQRPTYTRVTWRLHRAGPWLDCLSAGHPERLPPRAPAVAACCPLPLTA